MGSSRNRFCGAKTRSGTRCKRWPVPGRTRCRNHGGLSTGPRTAEGKARVLAARLEGLKRYWANLRATGGKPPGGRQKGAGWITKRMWERKRQEMLQVDPTLEQIAEAIEKAKLIPGIVKQK